MIKIKELRKNRKITLKTLAEELKTSPQVVSRYELEQAQPDFNMLVKIADYFDVSIDYLLGRTVAPGFSPAEYKTGVTDISAVNITADEDDLLEDYRELGIKKGAEAQAAIRSVLKNMLK